MVVWIPWGDGKTNVLKLKVYLGRSAVVDARKY
jgi:hypothetical protein